MAEFKVQLGAELWRVQRPDTKLNTVDAKEKKRCHKIEKRSDMRCSEEVHESERRVGDRGKKGRS
jgi:hypothetical protein